MLCRLEASVSSRRAGKQALPQARVIASLAKDGAQQRATAQPEDSQGDPGSCKERGNAHFRSEIPPQLYVCPLAVARPHVEAVSNCWWQPFEGTSWTHQSLGSTKRLPATSNYARICRWK